jgi:glucose-1-phosphate cytidylyltransferase
MKTIILAGGFGTRISEETETKPKPMVLIDEHPILWHIMQVYALQGYRDFVIALGYKGEVIKRWIKDLIELDGSFTVNMEQGEFKSLNRNYSRISTITALETGLNSLTGKRIKTCMQEIGNERVFATYGDGVGNVNLQELLKSHTESKKLVTLTAVRPAARFGFLEITEGNKVKHFGEKNQMDAGWINGGFFVIEPEVIEMFGEENDSFESGLLSRLAQMDELNAYKHEGFWRPMDTLRERQELARLAEKEIPDWFENLL